MIDPIFVRQGLGDLKLGIEASWREQAESSHNLVNAETPGFEPKFTDFREALLSGGEGHGEGYRLFSEDFKGDHEFNLEAELNRLSQSALAHSAMTRVLIRRYSDLRNVMREGR